MKNADSWPHRGPPKSLGGSQGILFLFFSLFFSFREGEEGEGAEGERKNLKEAPCPAQCPMWHHLTTLRS